MSSLEYNLPYLGVGAGLHDTTMSISVANSGFIPDLMNRRTPRAAAFPAAEASKEAENHVILVQWYMIVYHNSLTIRSTLTGF
jgi:hypothetical protein